MAPDRHRTPTAIRRVRTPARNAAGSLCPVSFMAKPNVVRPSRADTPTATANPSTKSNPSEVPWTTTGHRAEFTIGALRGKPRVGSCRGPRISQVNVWMATKLRRRVEMTSLTRRTAQRSAAMPA